jgi:hypothetical protein
MVLETLPSQGDIQDFHCDPTPIPTAERVTLEQRSLQWFLATPSRWYQRALITFSLVLAAEKSPLSFWIKALPMICLKIDIGNTVGINTQEQSSPPISLLHIEVGKIFCFIRDDSMIVRWSHWMSLYSVPFKLTFRYLKVWRKEVLQVVSCVDFLLSYFGGMHVCCVICDGYMCVCVCVSLPSLSIFRKQIVKNPPGYHMYKNKTKRQEQDFVGESKVLKKCPTQSDAKMLCWKKMQKSML